MKYITSLQNEQDYIPKSRIKPDQILGIDRIDEPYITLAYILAWTMVPPMYDPRKGKSHNERIVMAYARDFRLRAKEAGIKIGRLANIKLIFTYLQHGHEKSIIGHGKAKSIMADHLNKQFSEGEQCAL